MNIFESARVALEMLRMHKMRAFLTMLGVIIGVMSVTLIIMIASGFRHYLTYQFEKLGSDTIFMFYSGDFNGKRADRVANIDGLKIDDVQMLLDRVPSIDIASAAIQVPGQQVSYLDRRVKDPDVTATDQYFPDLNRVGVTEGRHIIVEDLNTRANVCVVGQEIKTKLFPSGEAIGKLITFNGITLEIVGVMEEIEMMGQSNGKDVLVPLTTAQDKWIGGESISFITTRPKPGFEVEDAMNDIWKVLMLKSGNKPIYRLDSRQTIVGVFGAIVGVAGAILRGTKDESDKDLTYKYRY